MADENTVKETCKDVKNTTPSTNIAGLADSVKSPIEDTELDELLDSALEEFGKPPLPASEKKPDSHAAGESVASAQATTVKDTPTASAATSGDQEALLSDLFSAEFIAQQQGGDMNIEELMKSVMSADPALTEHLHKLSQTADASAGVLCYTQNEDPFSDAELLKMVSGLNFEEGADSESGFLPLMHGMMKNLLSKEVLYPSLKEISSKYPTWLSANKEKLKTKDFDNYSKQYALMSEICGVFEQDDSSDSDDVKKQRYEEILDLMEQMQNLGQPPKDIAPGLPFDGQGLPQMPMNPEQCSLMFAFAPGLPFDGQGLPQMPINPEQCSLMFAFAPGLPFDGQGLPQMPMNPEQCSLMFAFAPGLPFDGQGLPQMPMNPEQCSLMFAFAPGLPFDGQGLPQMPMNPEQCSLMFAFAPGLPFDGQGLPQMPMNPEQCSLM
ncbi:hypothetical protein NP493_520g00005 [Ridgeia piscesae]|uniref:Peroxin-19 n=1 Tax=Ridgeia piscesae TaxID=27915 RepID=A0AAD9KY65_RIDPI|nr:hypothetical protein NP493_520g00005 [Ridgeia piscesae]